VLSGSGAPLLSATVVRRRPTLTVNVRPCQRTLRKTTPPIAPLKVGANRTSPCSNRIPEYP
jgi:hypothetical protein